ncbi:MAG: sulfatase [Halovenus sp.]|uniref:sulfatase n=1 Tax=Halovenus amylolytica TaxID=2500550 RepID=UPI000FE30431
MATQPNVIVVVLDTVRADRVSALGYDRETTPAFDAFAADATLYTDAVSQASWSVPSHASLFTGEYPSDHGATITRPVLTADAVLPELLSTGGYETYGISPNSYVRPATGFARGFDEFQMCSGVTESAVAADILGPPVNWVTSTAAVRQPIERLFTASRTKGAVTTDPDAPADNGVLDRVSDVLDRADAPFFLFCNLIDAHLPRSPAPEYVDRFVEPELADAPIPESERAYTMGDHELADRSLTRLRQLYDADLRTLDDKLAALLDRFRDAGVLDDSLVVLVSDHGEHLGEFDRIGHQFSVFDSVVSVPLAIQFPDGGPDRIDDQVEIRRLFETVLDETGLQSHPHRSLASGIGDDIARGSYASPMVDIEQLLWGDSVRYDPEFLGESLSFARTDEAKLISFDGEEWLFELPETADGSLPKLARERYAALSESLELDRQLAKTML